VRDDRHRDGGDVKRACISVGTLIAATAIALSAMVDTVSAAAAQLPDSTRVSVRLIGGITSETTTTGQSLQFVVINDVVVGNEVLIRKDTPVVGVVVRARRVHWGFTHRKPRLAFEFRYTTSPTGQVINLRSTPVRQLDNRIEVVRGGEGHALVWAGGADVFDAYVDGNYEIS
jgi:hypothetical protein